MANNKRALVYFHQGWTDIIVCMGMINYYRNRYSHITVLIRSGAKNLIDFYVRGLDGVNIIYLETDNGRWYGKIGSSTDVSEVQYHPSGPSGLITVPDNYDMMCHAEHDMWRKDVYKNYWSIPNKTYLPHFTEMFYVYYGIEYIERINSFSVNRNYDLENNVYDNFVKEFGNDYVLYHDDQNNHLHGGLHISTKIEFQTILPNTKYINLNKISDTFFDYIKVLQNAKELHFVDSIWGALCYQLDAKYSLFENKNIFVYCKRGHYQMFDSPVKLKNWKLI